MLGMALLGARSVPAVCWSVFSLPDLLRLGVLPVRGRFACVGGRIVDFGATNLPTPPPPPSRWYGLAPAGFHTRGLEMYPSLVSLFPFPGTTCTTLGGVVSSLDEDSSHEEYASLLMASLGVLVPPSCFVASRGVRPTLRSLSVCCCSSPTYITVAYARVVLKGGKLIFLAALFACLAPPRVQSGA